jgi:competence protein ComEC
VDTLDPSSSFVFDRAVPSPSLFKRRRPLFWLTLTFCCGITLDYLTTPRLPALGGIFIASVAFSAFVLFLRRSQKSPGLWLCGLTVALAGGMLLHALRSRIPAADDIARRTPATPSFVCVRGLIVESSREQGSEKPVWTLSVRDFGPDYGELSPASGRVRIRLNSDAPNFGEGDCVELRARLESPPEVTVPGAFDSQSQLEAAGIRRSGVANAESARLAAPSSWLRPDLKLRRLSATLAGRIDQELTDGDGRGSPQAALLNALLFGRRDRVDTSDREAFAINGTAHLLAIAGWHLQFLVMLFWLALGRAGISRRKAAWLVIGAVCAYCALTGAATPVVRATIMIVLYLLAPALGREADPLSVLAAAALGILTVAPAELFSAGFQLSFLAVLALATIYPALEDGWAAWRASPILADPSTAPPWRTWLLWRVRQTLFVSLAAWLGTAPAVAWHMGRFSVLSLLVNLIAVPLGSVCMITGLFTLALSFISTTLAGACGVLAGLALLALERVNGAFARLPFASIDLPQPAIPVLLVYAGVLAWVWIERRRTATVPRMAALFAACLFILNVGLFFREAPPAPRVTVLDLKLGRAALVEAPDGSAAMIDAGGPGQGARIAESLRRQGIARLSLLVISADDSDAESGAIELLERVPIARVILPRGSAASGLRRDLEHALAAHNIPYDWPDSKQMLRGPGDIAWEFADDGPTDGGPVSPQTALAIRLTLPGTRMLFVATRSNAALQRLLAKSTAAPLQCDILRLSTSGSAHWPGELSRLIEATACRTIVAGTSSAPNEIAGFDLAAYAPLHDLRVLGPHQDGSLRIQADVGAREQLVQAYRGGQWRPVE